MQAMMAQQQGMAPQGPQGAPMPQEGMGGPQPPMEEPMGPPMQSEEVDEGDAAESYLDAALMETNLAKKLRNKKTKSGTLLLDEIGEEVYNGWDKDEESRRGWMDRNNEWLKLAVLVSEKRSFPWPNSSNVKYPLLATAAMQFSARAYPALVPADGQVVKAKIYPKDPDGQLNLVGSKIARHMSHQIMYEMPCWEEDMDKTLNIMAISGICFKKTYHNSVLNKHHSHIVYPENLCVNYWAKNLEKAYRKTEILYYTENDYTEKVRNDEEFLEIDLPTQSNDPDAKVEKEATETYANDADKSTPYVFLSQHTFWDLDDDGYEEPYIITIHKDTKKVVRIIARWESKGVHLDADNKVIRIDPIEYFTAFPFIPNPDGSIYALGFGALLAPLNESINSIINQLIDSGTINNLQGGFIGKGLRLKMGISTWQPGEWKVVNATGEDLHKNIFPLPTKEPSQVLFNLLNMLITSGNQLASIAEIFVGKMPGQNTPATTTQETVKQGMAVFTAIYKRVYRSLDSEFKKIFRLNRLFSSVFDEVEEVLGEPLSNTDYDDDLRIIPGGDPTGDTESTRQAKIDAVGGLLQMQTIDPMAFTQWVLEAKEVPNYQKLIAKPQPPQPSPEEQKAQAEIQVIQQKAQADQQKNQMDLMAKQKEIELKAQMAELEAKVKQMELAFKQTEQAMKMQGMQQEHQMNMVHQVNQQHMDTQKQQADLEMQKVSQQQSLQHADENHQQAMKQQKQQAAMKPQGGTAAAKKGGRPKKEK